MELKKLKHADEKCDYTYEELQLAALGMAYALYENKQLDRGQTQIYLDLIAATYGAISSTSCVGEALIMMGREAKAVIDAKNGEENE